MSYFNNKLALSVLSAGIMMSCNALAHVTIAPENTFSLGESSREYVEGSKATLSLNLSHDCSGNAITDITLVLPNKVGLSTDDFYTVDGDGVYYGANALMGVKAKSNTNWSEVAVKKGDISDYYNHGVKNEDARAIQWLGGRVDNDHYDHLEFVATFPSIFESSCVSTLRVELPTVQYCENNTSIAWIGSLDTNFQVDDSSRVEETFEPWITVVRNSDNPLPAACGEGEEVVVKPSVEDMNTFLAIKDETGDGKANNEEASNDDSSSSGAIGLYGLIGIFLLLIRRKMVSQ